MSHRAWKREQDQHIGRIAIIFYQNYYRRYVKKSTNSYFTLYKQFRKDVSE